MPVSLSGNWPDEDLEITVRAAFGANLNADPTTWTFTDLSDRVLDRPITISRGVIVGGRASKTATGSVQLLNDDGALTPHHPGSPWWPNVDAGTPIDISVRTRTLPILEDTFTRTTASSWGPPDSGGSNWALAGSASFSTNGTRGLISYSANNQSRYARATITNRDVDLVCDFSLSAVATGQAVGIGPHIRSNSGLTEFLWCALDFSVAGTIGLRLRQQSTDLASATQPGLTYTGGTQIRLRVLAVGDRIRMKAWLAAGAEPAAWTIDHTLTVLTGAGTHLGIYSWVLSGNTNTLPLTFSVDNLTISQPRYPRIEGYITDIQPVFIPVGDGTTHSAVTVTIGGVGTVLELRDADDWSPMRRAIQAAAVPPVAYWHGEDGERSTSAASGIVGQPPLQVVGPAVFSFDTGDPEDSLLQRYGSNSLCSLAAGARLSGSFTPSTVQNAWTVGINAQVNASAVPTAEIRVMEWATSGTFSRWALVSAGTGHQVRAYNDAAGTSTTVCTSTTSAFNQLVTLDVQAVQNGGNIDVRFLVDTNQFASGSIAGTLGAPRRIDINPDRANTTASVSPYGIRFLVGHIAVHPTATAVTLPYYYNGPTDYRADAGWYEEPSHLRAKRVAQEGRIPFRQHGSTSISTPLNTQQPGASLGLLTAAVEAQSGGMLFDDGFGYGLVDRSSRYNLPAALAVDLAAYRRTGDTSPEEVLQPALSLRSPTIWTVERTGGSQTVWAASAAYRARRGDIAQKATLDLLLDTDTGPHARWRVHLGEDAQGANYPGASLDLTANPGLLGDYLLVRIGSRVQRLNQPTVAGVGTIDQVVEGMSETISRRAWTATLDGAPYAPWQAARQGVSVQQPSGTILNAGINAVVTTFVLATANPKNVWSLTAGFTILIDGEQVTIPPGGVGTVSGSGPYLQTVTGATRSVNGIVKTHSAGAPVTFANPDWLAL